ncbi:MAG: glycosyltransferase family 2 protein [Ruminococcaceae bacterium]|nr:glycosyltransferase family 2 protein [Oscillospiraceae bacterium]
MHMFSVIIPAYNAERFVGTAIESVLQQTNPDFEIIVVDDGSSDNTKSVVSQIRDSRIKYIYQENGGVSAARNTGIRNACGEFICFLDADDYWLANHLETVSGLIESYPHCSMFVTGHRIRLTTGEMMPRTEKVLQSIEDADFCSSNGYDLICKFGYFMHTNSICIRKESFDKVGVFEPGIKNGEDDDLWYRIYAYFDIAVSKTVTTIYNRENSTATAKTLFVQDWVFLKRTEEILSSTEVPPERKESLNIILERRKLSVIRQQILSGSKQGAAAKLLRLERSKVPAKKYLETWISLAVPGAIVRRIIAVRDRGFFH